MVHTYNNLGNWKIILTLSVVQLMTNCLYSYLLGNFIILAITNYGEWPVSSHETTILAAVQYCQGVQFSFVSAIDINYAQSSL